MALSKSKLRNMLMAATFLINALGFAAQAYVRSELPSRPPKSDRPAMMDTGQALKILKKLKSGANSTLVQQDIKYLEKANDAIDEAWKAFDNGDLTTCSDWVITAKGELGKVREGSLRVYTDILGRKLMDIRREVAAARGIGRT